MEEASRLYYCLHDGDTIPPECSILSVLSATFRTGMVLYRTGSIGAGVHIPVSILYSPLKIHLLLPGPAPRQVQPAPGHILQ